MQKYPTECITDFKAWPPYPQNERASSIEMAALNMVHTCGEYWDLWHGDGFSVETCGAVSRIWQEVKGLGFEVYKKN